MDLSKLPRLSKTETPPGDPTATDATAGPIDPAQLPPAPATPVAAANFCANCGAPLRPGARFCDSCGVQLAGPSHNPGYAGSYSAGVTPGIGAEVWVSAIIGLVLMLLGRSFAGWAIATMTGRTYNTGATWTDGNLAGQPVAYWDLEGFVAWNDSALFLFGLAMALEALVLALVFTKFRAKVPLILVALGITLLATGYNLFVSAKLLTANTIPLMSMLAVAFGGYIAVYEWRLLQQFRAAPAHRG